MKSITKVVIISIFMFLIIPDNLFAQGPPPWAPAHGYRAKTRHIYFPEQNFYYDIERRDYIYLNNGIWTVSVSVPAPFININLGRSVQVQLDFVGSDPYRYNSEHIIKYKKYKPRKHRVIVIQDDNNQGEYKHKGHGKHKHKD